jgi:hypothetical protein
VAGLLRSVIPQLDLRSWRTVDYRLKALPDHRLILALHQRGLPGLVTCDEEMLELPEVLAVVKQVAFHLVVCTRTGHDAVAATGLLLYNLPHVAKRYQPRRAQIWRRSGRASQRSGAGSKRVSTDGSGCGSPTTYWAKRSWQGQSSPRTDSPKVAEWSPTADPGRCRLARRVLRQRCRPDVLRDRDRFLEGVGAEDARGPLHRDRRRQPRRSGPVLAPACRTGRNGPTVPARARDCRAVVPTSPARCRRRYRRCSDSCRGGCPSPSRTRPAAPRAS